MSTIQILSEREKEIAECVARGLSEKEIAAEKFISPITVHNHTANIRKKLNARSAVDIARQFILSLDDPKQYFAALTFLVIQVSISVDTPEIDLKRAPKSVRVSRIFKPTKKYFA